LTPLLSRESTADTVIASLPAPVIARAPAVAALGPRLAVASTVGLIRRLARGATSRPWRETVMDQDRCQLPSPPTQHDPTTGAGIGCVQQWHDAELALTVARRCFEEWRQARGDDTPSTAIRHAYHTHEALHGRCAPCRCSSRPSVSTR
jgi:hypothetical protein